MKRLLTILLVALSLSSYAVDIDLLKQSLVGTWHPSRRWDNDNPNDENQLNFYLEGDRLMVKYVADYSAVYDKDRAEYYNIFNEFGTCLVDVHYDGTIDFHVNRKMMRYDKKGREERIGGGKYTYHLFFVDGLLAGTETWEDRYEIMQSTDDRGICKYKTLKQAEWRGETHAFPFGDEPYTTYINYYASDYDNVKKFYGNGRCNEISICNPDDYKYGALIGRWQGSANLPRAGWCGESPFMDIEVFVRDNQYYVVYYDSRENTNRIVERIYPECNGGELSFSYNAKQMYWGECEGYDWPWEYEFIFNLKRIFDGRNREWLFGTRERISVSGPLDACGIPEPEELQFRYFKSTLK